MSMQHGNCAKHGTFYTNCGICPGCMREQTAKPRQITRPDHCPHCGNIVERDDVSGELWCMECEKVLQEDELASSPAP